MSHSARARLMFHADLAYGPSKDERLDWYPPPTGSERPGSGSPVVVYVHGGAWRSGRKEDNSFAARLVVESGAHFVAIEFSSCPEVSLRDMAEQVTRALAWVHRQARRFGADGRRVVVVGHSSGAHLAALTLAHDWRRFEGIDRPFLRGGLCSSGSYDLAPLVFSSRNGYLRLDATSASDLSPARAAHRVACPVVVATGGGDSPLLQAQADVWTQAITASRGQAERMTVPGKGHFEVAETLATPDGALGRALLGLIANAKSDV